MHFFKLSKIRRPSSHPVTIDAKLSSSKIMSAACFDTSDPEIPMATPISAFFKAGESFTPSPVTATIFKEKIIPIKLQSYEFIYISKTLESFNNDKFLMGRDTSKNYFGVISEIF